MMQYLSSFFPILNYYHAVSSLKYKKMGKRLVKCPGARAS